MKGMDNVIHQFIPCATWGAFMDPWLPPPHWPLAAKSPLSLSLGPGICGDRPAHDGALRSLGGHCRASVKWLGFGSWVRYCSWEFVYSVLLSAPSLKFRKVLFHSGRNLDERPSSEWQACCI